VVSCNRLPVIGLPQSSLLKAPQVKDSYVGRTPNGKTILTTIGAAYFTIGGLFGIILGGSYVVSAILFAPAPSLVGRFYLVFAAGALGVVHGFVRTILWLPSLIMWLWSDQSFLHWLAPGLVTA
jgi:hypothetical protein